MPDDVWANIRVANVVPDASADWIQDRTGIQERRIADASQATSDLAIMAARQALENAAMAPHSVDLLIVATSTPDHQLPSCASIVQNKLGITDCITFDVNATCSGFLLAVDVARRYMHTDRCQCALVIGADTYSRILDWTDRASSVLFGDGAGAFVLCVEDGAFAIEESWFNSDATGAHTIIVPGGGSRAPSEKPVFRMNGPVVKSFAIRACSDAIRQVCARGGVAVQDLAYIIPHQANGRIIEMAMRELRLPLNRAFVNLSKYGNTATASIPLAMRDFILSKLPMPPVGAPIVLVTFGGGLSWGALLLRVNAAPKVLTR